MKHINHYARILVVLVMLLAPGLPAAQADDGRPPAVATATLAPNPPPDQPAGLPVNPTGCSFSATGFGTFTPPGPQAIPDFAGSVPGVITSTITVATANTYLWKVTVTTQITHTYPNDLDIHLISPAGTVIVLSDRNGGGHPGNVFSGTTWDDQAGLINGSGLPVTDYVFTPGMVAPLLNPQAPLGALLGQDPNGDWKLVVSDNDSADVGELLSWSLNIVALAAPPTYNDSASSTSSSPSTLAGSSTNTRSLSISNLKTPITAITLTTVITHALPATLNIFLVSPGGISITLSTGNGDTNANVFAGTQWNDKAILTNPPNLVTEYPYSPGVVASPLAPEEALSELNGTLLSGYWTLVVQNTGGTSGQIGRVSLQVQTATCLPELEARAYSDATHPRLGVPTTINLRSYNTGAAATGVVLTGSLSSLLTFQSASGTGWACVTPPPNTPGGTIVCSRASQASNTYATVVVSATMPLVPEHIPITVTLSSAQPDSYPSNNTNSGGVDSWAHSGNGNPLDIESGDGSMRDGGQDAYDGFGMLRMVVLDSLDNPVAADNPSGFNLAYGFGHRWNTTTPLSEETILVSRSLFGPAGADWLRYLDTFTNTGVLSRTLIVDWGGNLGSDANTVTAGTSSGDQTLAASDRWAVTIQQDVPSGPAVDAPVGYAFRSAADSSYQGPYDFNADPINSIPWPSTGNDNLGHQFRFTLQPGETRRLAYFVYRGLSETLDGPEDCHFYGGCAMPAAGSQVTLAENVVTALAANPPFCDLSPAERASLVNWPGFVEHCDLFLPVVRR